MDGLLIGITILAVLLISVSLLKARDYVRARGVTKLLTRIEEATGEPVQSESRRKSHVWKEGSNGRQKTMSGVILRRKGLRAYIRLDDIGKVVRRRLTVIFPPAPPEKKPVAVKLDVQMPTAKDDGLVTASELVELESRLGPTPEFGPIVEFTPIEKAAGYGAVGAGLPEKFEEFNIQPPEA